LSRGDADAFKPSRRWRSTLVARRGFAATYLHDAAALQPEPPDEPAMNAKLRELNDKNLTEP
jgi:hypothetical protein